MKRPGNPLEKSPPPERAVVYPSSKSRGTASTVKGWRGSVPNQRGSTPSIRLAAALYFSINSSRLPA